MKIRALALLLSSLALLTVLGCDKATPVAPSGSTIAISANPAVITSTGTSAITAIARKANGTPVNPGTQIQLATTLGTIDAVVATDSSGVAHATLHATGRAGTAKVTAISGAIAMPAEVDVMIGIGAGSITLQATPSSVPQTGGKIQLVALVRDDQGQPLAGASINFSSQIGTLTSGGAFKQTDSNGSASDTLKVSSADISTLAANTFTVTAQVAGSTGMLMSQTFMVNIAKPPVASFTFVPTKLTVVFTDTSVPRPTSWLWTFGDGSQNTSQNPVHTYAAAGSYAVTLTATNSLGSTSSSQVVTVSTQ
ncbi:MAG TPA: PKD domain-containing protein [Thermoanaerobaculia bacterium]|nr:PKD domain-containing protein [Thermoanaerobaculia bacterium]